MKSLAFFSEMYIIWLSGISLTFNIETELIKLKDNVMLWLHAERVVAAEIVPVNIGKSWGQEDSWRSSYDTPTS